MALRFIHTADVLDSPPATLALRDPALADPIGRRRAPRLRLADELPLPARR
jgi:hypothetical protein